MVPRNASPKSPRRSRSRSRSRSRPRSAIFPRSAAVLAVAWLSASSAPADETGREAPAWLRDGRLSWRVSAPLLAPRSAEGETCFSVKDPSVVRYAGRWHLFVTVRGRPRSHRIEYLSFESWDDTASAERCFLENHDGFFCAPQVFWYRPRKTWYLICQASDESWEPKYGAACATNRDIRDPKGWSRLQPLGHRSAGGKRGLDFWVICDERKAHLFFTTLDGRMWREETSLEAFPRGWSEPRLAIRADIFEAGHVYRLRGLDRYLALVEAQHGHGWRYYKAYLADRLDGEWTPLAATKELAFASGANTRPVGERWTDSISHGELLRAGCDERLEVDPARLRFLFQGVLDRERAGKPYGEIPWRLGLLEPLETAGKAGGSAQAEGGGREPAAGEGSRKPPAAATAERAEEER